MNATRTPTIQELKQIIAHAQTCIHCDAQACGTSDDPCYEFTPEGVSVCAQLPWWNGRPVSRATLLEWNEILERFEYANKGD
ncbi:MAG: hypothetical protein HDKAJFGB_02154 [Anaerolineae bacterium]|nr:hypothetical protein [Anaerolineae bacterium]